MALQDNLRDELEKLQTVSGSRKYFGRGLNLAVIGLGNCGFKIAETIALDERIPVKGLYLASTDSDKCEQLMNRMREYNLIRGADGIESISCHSTSNGGLYRIANETNIAIVAAGMPGGKDRNDAIAKNTPIIKDIATQFQGYRGRVIVLTNPVDIMTYLFKEYSGINADSIVGSSHVDTLRFRHFLDHYLRVNCDYNYSNVSNVFVIGPHDHKMIPLFCLAESHPSDRSPNAAQPWQPREFREDSKQHLRYDVIDYPNELAFRKQTTAISTAKAMQKIIHAIIYGGVVSVSTFGKFSDFAQGMTPFVRDVLEPNDPGLCMGYTVHFEEGRARIVPLPLKEDYDTARAYSHFVNEGGDPLQFKPDADDGPFAVLNRYLYVANKLADNTTPEIKERFQGIKARQIKAVQHAEVA